MSKSAFLVIFNATIGGQLAQAEVSTKRDPFRSRQVRRDCELAARAAFVELAQKIGRTFEMADKIKCVECIEVKDPDAETEH